jgi:hypothetical protein
MFGFNRSIVIEDEYKKDTQKCKMTLKHKTKEIRVDMNYKTNKTKEIRVDVNCTSWNEFEKIHTFLNCVAKTESGSLKSYDEKKKKVVVRGWRESVRLYVEVGLPNVYTLTLHDVIVRGT